MKDQEIMEGIRTDKNDKALAILYRHFPGVRKMILQHGGNKEDAEKIFREGLILLSRKMRQPGFTPGTRLSVYLERVCRLLWKDQRKKSAATFPNDFDTGLTPSEEKELRQLAEAETNAKPPDPMDGTGRYLTGRLSHSEKETFEKQLAEDPALQQAVALQQAWMTATEQAALKQSIERARRIFRIRKYFKNGGLTGLGLLILVLITIYGNRLNNPAQRPYTGVVLPIYNERIEKQWADADKYIPPQIFWIEPGQDTVIETKDGILFSIPANGFLDERGKTVKGKVELVIKEALDAPTLMKAGLSTQNGTALLETGGMFFLDARQHEKILKINPRPGIYAELPADPVKPGMQLFQGKRMTDGSIDWQHPGPLEHVLVPMDIHVLDFYPPHYLDSLQQWGYDSRNRSLTDSLYFSLARLFENPSPGHLPGDGAIPGCGLNPARVKAIWNDQFQNTLISTREFERRMPFIHQSSNRKILDLYVGHPDLPLSKIDSMAARLAGSRHLKKIFRSFAARQDGKVAIGDAQFRALRKYDQNKSKAFRGAVQKTLDAFGQAATDTPAAQGRKEPEADSTREPAQEFRQEFAQNLKQALRQFGYDTSFRPPPTDIYAVRLSATGWFAVNRVATASAAPQRNPDRADSSARRKAVIRYMPLSFQLAVPGAYDRVYVYLLPGQWSSFIRLAGSDGKYALSFHEPTKYTLVCIAYDKNQAYFYSQVGIQQKEYAPVELQKTDPKELDRQLNRLGSIYRSSGGQKEPGIPGPEEADQKRKKHVSEETINKVLELIFPCATKKMIDERLTSS